LNNEIFISIPSFRDIELVPTLHSLIENCDQPENLKITIAWQHGDEDFEKGQLDEFNHNSYQFNIIDIPFLQSNGACWARSEIQQRYSGEQWHLQLDSHHRFVPHWDTLCKDMILSLKEKGYKKPLLTAYLPSFDPFNDPSGRSKECWRLDWDRFIPESPFFVLPASMTEEEMKFPLMTRFFSGHFVFVEGNWINEVPYDPHLFFHGEEGSLAVRSWTSGYDLFNPNVQIAFHEYTRNYREGMKVWDKNTNWVELNKASHLRHRKLFEMDGEKKDIDFGPYDFGKERSLQDYERFAGIQFKTRGVQKHTLDHKPAPNPSYEDEEKYQNSFERIFRHCLDIWKGSLKEEDYHFICVIFKDSEGNEIYRHDLNEHEVKNLLETTKGDWLNIWSQFHYSGLPASWVFWPNSKSKGWMEPIHGVLKN
jgi:hypothetical protein